MREGQNISNYTEAFPFWQNLTSHEQDLLSRTISRHCYPDASARLFQERRRGLWAVTRGEVCVQLHSEEGQQIGLFRVQAGEIGICLSEQEGLPDTYSIEMIAEKGSAIYFIPEEGSGLCIWDIACIAECRTNVLIGTTKKLTELIGQLSFCTLRERLQQRLCEYGVEQESDTIWITHEKLACELGTSREVISRVLKQLSRDGLLLLNRKSITLLDECCSGGRRKMDGRKQSF